MKLEMKEKLSGSGRRNCDVYQKIIFFLLLLDTPRMEAVRILPSQPCDSYKATKMEPLGYKWANLSLRNINTHT
jgi:hypothetical protein